MRRQTLVAALALVSLTATAALAGRQTARAVGDAVAPETPPAPLQIVEPPTGPSGGSGSAQDRIASSLPPLKARRPRGPDPILERSIFDSAALDKPTEEGAETDLDIVLVSTMLAWPEEFSSAWIGVESTETVEVEVKRKRRRRRRKRRRTRRKQVRRVDGHGYAIGDTILGTDATVKAIRQREVVLERANGHTELLRFDIDKEEEDKPKKRASSRAAADKDGVESLSAWHKRIDREVLDKLADNPAQLAKLGRAVPHKGPNGDVDGYRLSGIRRRSLGRKLGLRSGDVIHSVEGLEITSMGAALQAFEALQSEDDLSIALTRRGQKETLRVDIE